MSLIKPGNTTISVSLETYELLQTIKSCFQLKNKKPISYNEIIGRYVIAGLRQCEPRILQIMEIIAGDDAAQTHDTAESGQSES